MFSAELTFTIEAAYREAATRQHGYFCVEHLLYAMLFDPLIVEIISNCGGDVAKIKESMEDFFDQFLDKVSSQELQPDRKTSDPQQTAGLQRVLQRSVMHMQSAGKKKVTAVDVLVAIFSEQDSHATFALENQGISRLDVINFVSHGISKDEVGDFDADHGEESSNGEDEEPEEVGAGKVKRPNRKGILEQYAENLTEKAKKGELDPIIGREVELERAIKILCRRQKNNPIFLGDPGVGKSVMANALAAKIVSGHVPKVISGAQVFSLTVGSLIAGTKFRGEFEDRLRKLLLELSSLGNAILFIDEIHTLVGAGATGSGSMDAANLLKPALATGKLRCVGSTTHEDYKKSFEKDRALSRRFSPIDLVEPTHEQTVEILRGLRSRFEEHHSVKYSEAALKVAVELSAKHINDRFLPDKAIDVIDEAGAANSVLMNGKRKKQISEREIEAVVAAIAKVPIKSVSASDEQKLKSLASNLELQVFGQSSAVAAVSLAIKRSRASLKMDQKPMGSFLFAGPTGVGKTELAKALARELGVHFHRFDMTEYMEKHAVARLIGAPPGYVGYEEGGQLTDMIRRQPHAVLLFDEIEKAHEDIYNILLQVMDDATLTDSQGKKADFRNVILIMTTNAGSDKAAAIGFGEARVDSHREQAVKKLFKPEFRNRLDEVIYFNPLPFSVVGKIVDKFISELEGQLRSRKITIEISQEVRSYLSTKGFDAVLGARPMNRVIQREIKDKLADEILFGKLKHGGNVSVSLEKFELAFKIKSKTPEKQPA